MCVEPPVKETQTETQLIGTQTQDSMAEYALQHSPPSSPHKDPKEPDGQYILKSFQHVLFPGSKTSLLRLCYMKTSLYERFYPDALHDKNATLLDDKSQSERKGAEHFLNSKDVGRSTINNE